MTVPPGQAVGHVEVTFEPGDTSQEVFMMKLRLMNRTDQLVAIPRDSISAQWKDVWDIQYVEGVNARQAVRWIDPAGHSPFRSKRNLNLTSTSSWMAIGPGRNGEILADLGQSYPELKTAEVGTRFKVGFKVRRVRVLGEHHWEVLGGDQCATAHRFGVRLQVQAPIEVVLD